MIAATSLGNEGGGEFTFDQLADQVSDFGGLFVPPHLEVDLLNINKLTCGIFRERLNDAGDDFSNVDRLTVPAHGDSLNVTKIL